MTFDPTIAAIRFGTGQSPRHPPPRDRVGLLADLTGPDRAQDFPLPGFAQAAPDMLTLRDAARARVAAEGTAGYTAARAAERALQLQARDRVAQNFATELARAIDAPLGLRERLVGFWGNHFTVRARGVAQRHLISPYVEDAIRPHVGGTFRDMLRAVATHPIMLLYLQQVNSVGPNSTVGQRQGRGLNENLAREMLELHTLGVGAGYTQGDVTELAELLSGLTYNIRDGFRYNPRMAEPGAETVLGVTYGAEASLDTVFAALDDLAAHPATAAHLARKLAVHFLSDLPDPGLVASLERAYLASGGDLLAVTMALLEAPEAWAPVPAKVRSPWEYLVAGCRALGLSGADVMALPEPRMRQVFGTPLRVMGQPWQRPPGPDGWPEGGADWIIPQTMAARISWAMEAPARLLDDLPDPRDLVLAALGPAPAPAVVFAAGAAETRAEGVGVVLASAAFQRR